MLVRCTLWCTRTDLGLLVEVTVHPSGVAVCLGSADSPRRSKGKVHRVITVHSSGLLGFWVSVASILLEIEVMEPPLEDMVLKAKSKHGLAKHSLSARGPDKANSGKPVASSHPTIRVEPGSHHSVVASAGVGTSSALPKTQRRNAGTSVANRRSPSLAVPSKSLARDPNGRRSRSRGRSRGRSRPLPSQKPLNIAGNSINQQTVPDSVVSKRKGSGKSSSMIPSNDTEHPVSVLKADPPTALPDFGQDGLATSTSPLGFVGLE
ncbi:hypothetical protein NL676_030174 [Syzygium grande]|nr:hypothetical protein NL676_030174 [Syzygium grande]